MEKNKNDWYASDEQAKAYGADKEQEEASVSRNRKTPERSPSEFAKEISPETSNARTSFAKEISDASQITAETQYANEIPEELKPLAEAENQKEEFATEVVPSDDLSPNKVSKNNEQSRYNPKHFRGEESATDNRGLGIFALIIAIASLFVWPYILGSAAVVLGFVAWGRGNRSLGIWSIAIGLISFLAYTIFLPVLY